MRYLHAGSRSALWRRNETQKLSDNEHKATVWVSGVGEGTEDGIWGSWEGKHPSNRSASVISVKYSSPSQSDDVTLKLIHSRLISKGHKKIVRRKNENGRSYKHLHLGPPPCSIHPSNTQKRDSQNTLRYRIFYFLSSVRRTYPFFKTPAW
jgi:hypothetical protein